jgi:hypothetical protein
VTIPAATQLVGLGSAVGPALGTYLESMAQATGPTRRSTLPPPARWPPS